MSENPLAPQPSLYGEEPPAPKAKGPALGEILSGLCTDPVGLFRRIREADAPVWLWPAVLSVLAGVVLVVAWALKVDVDAMMRPLLEQNPQLGASQIDSIVEMQGKLMLPMGVVGALFGTAVGVVLMGLLYWGLGVAAAEDRERKASFLAGINMASVLGLVLLPYQLLTTLVCLLRPVGGLSPEKLSPTCLGFFLRPEHPKLYALFCTLDLFILASWVLTYLAARHLLRAKAWGAALCVAIPAAFMLLKVLFAK